MLSNLTRIGPVLPRRSDEHETERHSEGKP